MHAAIVSSVVPTLAHEYEQMIERYLDGRGALVGPELKTGMPIRIDRPQELGADRLVNAIAAYERVGGACIAVDFGTAINYDVVSSAGEYLGGVISPGIEISLEALSARAARLPRVDIEAPAPRDRQGHAGGDPGRGRLRLRGPGRRHRRPPAGGARRGGHRDRDGRLRGGDRPVLRAGRRGGRPAHASGAQVDLGAQQQLTFLAGRPGVGWTSWPRSPHSPSRYRSTIAGAWSSCACRARWTRPRRRTWARRSTRSWPAGAGVVLDLSEVEFMDLHGLAVLMRASRRARADGGSFAVERPAPCVTRLFELVRLDGEIRILPDDTGPPAAA